MINTVLKWLEDTSLAITIRRSIWLYPALEIVHIAGIVVLVGAAFMFDLRLLGFSTKLSVTGLANHLLTWSRRGLLLVIPSGLLLFVTNAATLGYNPVFWLKMSLLIVAGLNALVFHRFTSRSVANWEIAGTLPVAAKAAAVVSIAVWLCVIACGRLLAY